MQVELDRVLRISREMLDLFWTEAPAPMEVFRADGTIAAANPAAARLRDSTSEALAGRPLADLGPAPLASERLAVIERVLATAQPAVLSERRRGHYAVTTYRRLDTAEGRMVLAVTAFVARNPVAPAPADLAAAVPAEHDDPGDLERLTDKEMAVLRRLAQGLTHDQIAQALDRSAKTVEWHRSSIGRKLGLSTVVELTRFAVERGLVAQADRGSPPSRVRRTPSRNGSR